MTLSRSSATLRVLEIPGVADLDGLPGVIAPCLFANLRDLRLLCLPQFAADRLCAFRPSDEGIGEFRTVISDAPYLSFHW